MKVELFILGFLGVLVLFVFLLKLKLERKINLKIKSQEKINQEKKDTDIFAEHNESLYQDLRKDPQKYWIDSAKNAYNPYNKRGY